MKSIDQFFGKIQVLKSPFFSDERGGFLKVFNKTHPFLGNYDIQQVNYVDTVEKGTLRGLHYQKESFSESKLFRVIKGKIQLAFVNVENLLQSDSIILDDPSVGVLIPRGFATGYLTLADNTTVLYLSDNVYHAESENGISWNDPKIGIEWMVDFPILSEKDKNWEKK